MKKDFSNYCLVSQSGKNSMGPIVFSFVDMLSGLKKRTPENINKLKTIFFSEEITNGNLNREEINSLVQKKIKEKNLDLDINFQKVKNNVAKNNAMCLSANPNFGFHDILKDTISKCSNKKINKELLEVLTNAIYHQVFDIVIEILIGRNSHSVIVFESSIYESIYSYHSNGKKRKEKFTEELNAWLSYNLVDVFCRFIIAENNGVMELTICKRS